MSHTPLELCGTAGFVELFMKPMTDDTFRETYVMANYQGGCDFYTRFATDMPGDCYQHMEAPISEPDLWWTILNEPRASGRTMAIPRQAWRHVMPRLHDGVAARL